MQGVGENARTTAAEWLSGDRRRREVAGHCARHRVARWRTAHLSKDHKVSDAFGYSSALENDLWALVTPPVIDQDQRA